MNIVYSHKIHHSCRGSLLDILDEAENLILYGSVALCGCGKAWMLVSEKSWWVRGVRIPRQRGWWVKEPRHLRHEREETLADLDAGLQMLLDRRRARKP